jgi:hypothetical protein
MKMARGGPHKGNPFEREIAKCLSLWFSDGTNDNIFWRTHQSGGRATTRAKAGKEASLHCGDIGAVNPIGEPLLKVLSFELKRGYNKAVLHDLIDMPVDKQQAHAKQIEKGHKDKIDDYPYWIAKAERDRLRAGALFWAIIHKRDYREALLVAPSKLFYRLGVKALTNLSLRSPVIKFCLDSTTLTVVHFDAFLQVVKPKDILVLLEQGPENTKETSC